CVERAGNDVVHLCYLPPISRCPHNARHHFVSDRLAYAIQPRRPALSFILELHYPGDAYNGGILCFRYRKRLARATVAGESRSGNYGWKKSDRIDSNRFAGRQGLRQIGRASCRERVTTSDSAGGGKTDKSA